MRFLEDPDAVHIFFYLTDSLVHWLLSTTTTWHHPFPRLRHDPHCGHSEIKRQKEAVV